MNRKGANYKDTHDNDNNNDFLEGNGAKYGTEASKENVNILLNHLICKRL